MVIPFQSCLDAGSKCIFKFHGFIFSVGAHGRFAPANWLLRTHGEGCELGLSLNGDLFIAFACAYPNTLLALAFAFARFISTFMGMFESKSKLGSKFSSKLKSGLKSIRIYAKLGSGASARLFTFVSSPSEFDSKF